MSHHQSYNSDCINVERTCNKDYLNEGFDCLNEDRDCLKEGYDEYTKRSLYSTKRNIYDITTLSSDRPDTPIITNNDFPLSNYQHFYTSAFSSINNPKPTNIVKFNDDTLLSSFRNAGNFQQNQPHLAENTPTTDFDCTLTYNCTKQSTHNANNSVNLSASDVTCDSENQQVVTGLYTNCAKPSVNVIKVDPIFMARTNRLRKYHALQAEKNKLDYPQYNYTCENVRKTSRT
jgi:hypothetical protein